MVLPKVYCKSDNDSRDYYVANQPTNHTKFPIMSEIIIFLVQEMIWP